MVSTHCFEIRGGAQYWAFVIHRTLTGLMKRESIGGCCRRKVVIFEPLYHGNIGVIVHVQEEADLDYTMVVVGYNATDSTEPYWIARATFGMDFGLDGHIYIVCQSPW